MKRYDMRKLLKNPKIRKQMITRGVVALQDMEGVEVSLKEAERIYDQFRIKNH